MIGSHSTSTAGAHTVRPSSGRSPLVTRLPSGAFASWASHHSPRRHRGWFPHRRERGGDDVRPAGVTQPGESCYAYVAPGCIALSLVLGPLNLLRDVRHR